MIWIMPPAELLPAIAAATRPPIYNKSNLGKVWDAAQVKDITKLDFMELEEFTKDMGRKI